MCYLDLVDPPLEREHSCLEGYVGFVELFKEYEVGDVSEEEIEEEEVIGEKEEIEGVEELGVEYFDKFSTRDELSYQPFYTRCPTIIGGNPSNLKIPCNIGYIHVWKAYTDLNSPINIMSRMHYNWIMKRQFEPRRDLRTLEE
ncbi:hypothetical protein Tco_1516324 [Tanacetum coccineum]